LCVDCCIMMVDRWRRDLLGDCDRLRTLTLHKGSPPISSRWKDTANPSECQRACAKKLSPGERKRCRDDGPPFAPKSPKSEAAVILERRKLAKAYRQNTDSSKIPIWWMKKMRKQIIEVRSKNRQHQTSSVGSRTKNSREE
jgi:ribosomal protein L39E